MYSGHPFPASPSRLPMGNPHSGTNSFGESTHLVRQTQVPTHSTFDELVSSFSHDCPREPLGGQSGSKRKQSGEFALPHQRPMMKRSGRSGDLTQQASIAAFPLQRSGLSGELDDINFGFGWAGTETAEAVEESPPPLKRAATWPPPMHAGSPSWPAASSPG